MIMNEFILYSALVFIYLFAVCVCVCVCVCITRYSMLKCDLIQCSGKRCQRMLLATGLAGSDIRVSNKMIGIKSYIK